MTVYYNEWEAYPAQWLRNLIEAGHLPAGDVDERSIKDVRADDLKKYKQCHFFAGIGGWSIALRLAGWADDREVWTGSCPCQPFSVAGKQGGKQDGRHLWPTWFHLIAACKPSVVFGEQVSGAITHGWLDDTFDDLESQGYETAAAVLPACSVGAPHKRDRIWFVADDISGGRREGNICHERNDGSKDREGWPGNPSRSSSVSAFMADAPSTGRNEGQSTSASMGYGNTLIAGGCDVSDAFGHRLEWCAFAGSDQFAGGSVQQGRETAGGTGAPGSSGSFWQSQSGVGLLANGIPARSHKLRAYGNAIVPQVAAEFIKAYMECRP